MPNGWGRAGRKSRPIDRRLAQVERRAAADRVIAPPDVPVTRAHDGTSVDPSGPVDGATSVAVVTFAISARTGTASPFTPGVGKIQLCEWSAGSLATYGPDTLAAYNTTLSTIAVGKLVQVKLIYGEWFVDVADC